MQQRTQKEIRQNWKGDHEAPIVSICCITYNHEPYIAEAIDGFLMQETDFPFEILIHDDCSTDKTALIIRNYEKKYPNIIKPIYQRENQYSKGVKPNPTFNFPRAKGKYIALCEGDDYWTDPLKLQKQVNFLGSNPEYTGSGHQAKIVNSCSKITRDFYYKKIMPSILYKNDFMRACPFQTATFVFRSEIIKKHPLDIGVTAGDKAVMLLVSRFGLIRYFDQPMSCYRQHEGGLSSYVTKDLMIKDLNIIPWIKKIDPDFSQYQYTSYIHETIMLLSKDSNMFFFSKHFFLYTLYSFSFFPRNLLHVSNSIKVISIGFLKRKVKGMLERM